MGASHVKPYPKKTFVRENSRHFPEFRGNLAEPYSLEHGSLSHQRPYRRETTLTRASSPCLNTLLNDKYPRHIDRNAQKLQGYAKVAANLKIAGAQGALINQHSTRNTSTRKKQTCNVSRYRKRDDLNDEDEKLNHQRQKLNDFDEEKTISDCMNSQFDALLGGDQKTVGCEDQNEQKIISIDIPNNFKLSPQKTFAISTDQPSAKKLDYSECPKEIMNNIYHSLGNVNSPSSKIKSSTQTMGSSRLSDKPPTPPPKTNGAKTPTPQVQTSYHQIRNKSGSLYPGSPTRFSNSINSPKPATIIRNTSSRSASLPRQSTVDHSSPSLPISVQQLHKKPLCNSSTPNQSEAVSLAEKQHCLSRIEYTFYINDTEACQRPFFDRRVEAIARASQCNVCLHKPPPGHKPVYYKGIRVLPVTISARTMVTLKRCIARLDTQYPHFNVKAFCPPDMY